MYRYSLHTQTDANRSYLYLVPEDSDGKIEDAVIKGDPIVLLRDVTLMSDEKGRKIVEVEDPIE